MERAWNINWKLVFVYEGHTVSQVQGCHLGRSPGGPTLENFHMHLKSKTRGFLRKWITQDVFWVDLYDIRGPFSNINPPPETLNPKLKSCTLNLNPKPRSGGCRQKLCEVHENSPGPQLRMQAIGYSLS